MYPFYIPFISTILYACRSLGLVICFIFCFLYIFVVLIVKIDYYGENFVHIMIIIHKTLDLGLFSILKSIKNLELAHWILVGITDNYSINSWECIIMSCLLSRGLTCFCPLILWFCLTLLNSWLISQKRRSKSGNTVF